MNCPKCGAENTDDAKYCSLCLESFQTPAEIELAQEVKQKKEEAIQNKPRFKPLKFVAIILVVIGLSSAAFVGIRMARKSVGTDLMALTGVSTDKKGIKIKRNIAGKSVEAFIGKLPEGFPNFPIYKGAEIKIGQRVYEQEGKITYLVIAETNAKAKDIIAFYNDYLSKNGYEVSNPAAEGNEDIGMLSFSKFTLTGKILVSEKSELRSINLSMMFSG